MLRGGIARSYENFIFILSFLWAFILFSTQAAPTYIPTKSVGGFPFLHTLSNICCL